MELDVRHSRNGQYDITDRLKFSTAKLNPLQGNIETTRLEIWKGKFRPRRANNRGCFN